MNRPMPSLLYNIPGSLHSLHKQDIGRRLVIVHYDPVSKTCVDKVGQPLIMRGSNPLRYRMISNDTRAKRQTNGDNADLSDSKLPFGGSPSRSAYGRDMLHCTMSI